MKNTVIKLFAVAAGILAGLGEKVHAAVFGYMANQGMVAMLTTKADTFTGKFPVRNTPVGSCVEEVGFPFAYPETAPSVNDILAIAKVPVGVDIIDWYVVSEDADSNGAPTLEFTVGSLNAGLTDIATAYKATVAVGETGAIDRAATAAAFAEGSAAERAIGLKFTTAAATYATGKKGVLVLKLKG